MDGNPVSFDGYIWPPEVLEGGHGSEAGGVDEPGVGGEDVDVCANGEDGVSGAYAQ